MNEDELTEIISELIYDYCGSKDTPYTKAPHAEKESLRSLATDIIVQARNFLVERFEDDYYDEEDYDDERYDDGSWLVTP